MSEAILFEHVDGRFAVAWNSATAAFTHNDPASHPDYGLQPLPEKMPASIYGHAEFGNLYDRLAVQLYAVGYAQKCIAALAAPAAAPEPADEAAAWDFGMWLIEMMRLADDYHKASTPAKHRFRRALYDHARNARMHWRAHAALAAPEAAQHLTDEELSSLQTMLSALPTNEERNLLHARIVAHRGALQAPVSHQAASAYGVTAQTRAVRDVLAERRRQVADKGWTPEHDDELTDGSMAVAAACYALADRFEEISEMGLEVLPQVWPWTLDDWKPGSRWRELVKAGALILAELDRIDRAAGPSGERV